MNKYKYSREKLWWILENWKDASNITPSEYSRVQTFQRDLLAKKPGEEIDNPNCPYRNPDCPICKSENKECEHELIIKNRGYRQCMYCGKYLEPSKPGGRYYSKVIMTKSPVKTNPISKEAVKS